MVYDIKRREIYGALNFSEIYPRLNGLDDTTYYIRSEIYRLRHLGWEKDEIIDHLLSCNSIECSITEESIYFNFQKCLMRGFDYNPIGNMHNTSRITPIINAGLTALRFHQKKYPNFQFPEPKFLLPSNRPNSDSICQRRRKMLMLKLSGADEDMICNIMPTYYKGLIQSETSTIRKSVLPNISATYKECLLNYNFREVAIIYSILLGHYAAGHLSFGTPCEVNDFIVDTLDKHKLKIFAANEVNNLIKTA